MLNLKNRITLRSFTWTSLFTLTFLAAYLYIFSEWLFIVTRPSFLSTVTFLRKIAIFFFTGALLTGICFAGLALLYAASRLPWLKKFPQVFLAIGSLVPVTIVTLLAVLLLDNFTYTVFKFGIVSTSGLSRGLYLLLFLFLLAYLFFWINQILSRLGRASALDQNRMIVLSALLVFILVSFSLTFQGNRFNNPALSLAGGRKAGELPNIILITADGVDATHTSAYGYDLDTTPTLKELGKTSLVGENVFSNSGNTGGSIISFYTGKYPTETRVLYMPDILKGKDAYEHLPGILKSLGYYNVQMTHPYYADAYDLNVQNGFDRANGRTDQQSQFFRFVNKSLQTDYAYFVYETTNRITDRLLHLLFIRRMASQADLVSGNMKIAEDKEKLNTLFKYLLNKSQPVFADIHWMGTHGPTYAPRHPLFSKGLDPEKQGKWDQPFYDDSLLEFDAGVARVIQFLKEHDLYEKTILIIGSDHGMGFVTTKRIPLIIHFPGGQYTGVRDSDLQNIDLAPTLLDFLGITKPAWMEGDSFLRGEPGNRPIFGTGVGDVTVENTRVVKELLKPPFYQFGYITVDYCSTWYRLDLATFEFTSGPIEGHTQPCPANAISEDQVMGWIIDHLKAGGFDTSAIPRFPLQP